MGKISFKKLHALVANIDPVWDDSHPVMFTVVQKGEEHCEGQTYIAGLANELIDYDGKTRAYEECQFIRLCSTGKVIDLQDESLMSFDKIGRTLKEKCAIEKGCTIYLEKDCSFGGEWYYVDEKDCYDRSWFEEERESDERLENGELEEELAIHNS